MDDPQPTIVMVDDDAHFLDTVKKRLDLFGEWAIFTYTNIDIAFQHFRTQPVDLILADIRMPQLNGIDFLVEAHRLCPDAIKILMTSFAEQKTAVEAINRIDNLYFFFDKGRSWHELAVILRNGLEKKKLSLHLRQRIQQLESIQDDLLREKKRAVVGELIQGTCHNINTPLGVILGQLDMMRWDIQHLQTKHDLSLTSLLDKITHIQDATLRIQDITHNLMLKSQLDQLPQRQEFSLHDLIHRELKFLEADPFLRHRVQVSLELCPSLPKLFLNYGDMSQVFGNLIRNALDALFDQPQPQIKLVTWATEDHVGLEVHDNGPGVPEELRQRIFDPFFSTKKKLQESSTTSEITHSSPQPPQGMGLGLYSVVRLLDTYGGHIEVDSSPLGGACFHIILPRQSQP